MMKRVGKWEMRAMNETQGLSRPGDQKKLGLDVDKISAQSTYRGLVGGKNMVREGKADIRGRSRPSIPSQEMRGFQGGSLNTSNRQEEVSASLLNGYQMAPVMVPEHGTVHCSDQWAVGSSSLVFRIQCCGWDVLEASLWLREEVKQ